MNAPSEISRTPARAHIEASSALADAVAPLGLADSRYPIVDRERVLSLAALTVVACMLAATIIVMRGGYPPVFNQSPRQYAMLNMGLLASLAISAVILSVHVGLGRWPHAAKILKILLVAALTANLSFGLLERFVVGIDGAKLIHNFHNRVVDGHPLPLQQSNSYSEFGFRTDRVEPKQPSSFRYLMLGNSYTKGSGSSLATNYPQVTERAVNESGDGMKASVFAGGVDGYGLEEADRLFSLLSTDGYKFEPCVLRRQVNRSGITGTRSCSMPIRSTHIFSGIFCISRLRQGCVATLPQPGQPRPALPLRDVQCRTDTNNSFGIGRCSIMGRALEIESIWPTISASPTTSSRAPRQWA